MLRRIAVIFLAALFLAQPSQTSVFADEELGVSPSPSLATATPTAMVNAATSAPSPDAHWTARPTFTATKPPTASPTATPRPATPTAIVPPDPVMGGETPIPGPNATVTVTPTTLPPTPTATPMATPTAKPTATPTLTATRTPPATRMARPASVIPSENFYWIGTARVTMYTCVELGGCDYTAYGLWPYEGIVAVDPTLIPLGATVWLDGLGIFLAADTGSLIYGNRVDVYVNDYHRAINWGVQERRAAAYITP
jgi:3D (Asp-Asp-Asp) domain-containing protein